MDCKDVSPKMVDERPEVCPRCGAKATVRPGEGPRVRVVGESAVLPAGVHERHFYECGAEYRTFISK